MNCKKHISKIEEWKIWSFVKILFESAGLLAFIFYVIEIQKSNVTLELEVIENNKMSKSTVFKTSVKNEGVHGKTMIYAALFVANHKLSFYEQVLSVVENTQLFNDDSTAYALKRADSTLINSKGAVIKLPIYYIDQTNIGNEKINYSFFFDSSKLDYGIYDVKFYVFFEGALNGCLEGWSRVTQDLLIIEEVESKKRIEEVY